MAALRRCFHEPPRLPLACVGPRREGEAVSGAHTVTVKEAAAMLAKTAGDSYAAGWNAGQRAAYLAAADALLADLEDPEEPSEADRVVLRCVARLRALAGQP